MSGSHLVDAHVHTDNSCDGHDSLMVICEHANRAGLRGLAVTDHAECHRYWRDHFDRAVRNSFFEIKKAQAAFRGQLAIGAGLELGQPLHDPAAAQDALSAAPWDYVIGSLHLIKEHPDFWKVDYTTADVPALLDCYFQELYDMVCWGKFDALGHMTYPLRYIVGREKIPVDLTDYRDAIAAIMHKMIDNHIALELNTQGMRTEYGRPTPDLDMFQLFHALGGRMVCVGSDAHFAKDVGANVADGFAVLQAAGFDEITIFDRREPIMLSIM